MNREENILLEKLFTTYYNGLYRLARKKTGNRETAAELVQETFLTAAKKVSQIYDHPKHEGWLYKTLNYKIKENIRINAADTTHMQEKNGIHILNAGSTEDIYFNSSYEKDFLDKFKGTLSKRELKFIKYKYIDELKNKEIAIKMNSSYTAVSTMGYNVKNKVRKYYEDKRKI